MNDRHYRLQTTLMDFALEGGVAVNLRDMPVNRLRRRPPLDRLSNTARPQRRGV